MKSKLLLVSANTMTDPYPVYPLGISYLHAYLMKHASGQFTIELFDFIDKTYDDYIKALQTFQPDFIGISLRNVDDVNVHFRESFIQHYKNIVDFSRKFSNSYIIVGGSGYSIFPELMFQSIKPDFGIYGEGEQHFYELLVALRQNADYTQINNLIYRSGNNIIFNKTKQSLKKIDLLFDEVMLEYYWQHSGMLNIQTKRGCPYRCIYCTYPIIEGHNVRTLETEHIIDKLEYLVKQKGIDYFFFTDSIFNIDNNFNYRLAEQIIQKQLKFQWGAYFNFCNIDEKLLSLLKRAGLTHIEFGTDSLSETMLQNYEKPFGVADILRISELCVKLEIHYAHFLILCGIGETEDTIRETFDNSKRIERSVFFPFIGLRIYPGTKLQQMAISEGKIRSDDDLLLPTYYISENVETEKLREKAAQTGKRWVFPDDKFDKMMVKMRSRGKKGPLWEYLIL